ncbi:MAG: zinc-dependent metalloprotease [Bacteroidales bacterium]|nr:zinc-dependent metalloprotease [Bacteroidales bacterium]
MKKTRIYVMALCALLCAGAQAKDKKKKGEEPQKVETPAPVKEGLFGVSQQKDKWYFTVPDSILGRPILAITRYVASPVDAGVYGGEMVNNQTIYWEKGVNNTLILRSLVLNAEGAEDSEIKKAVRVSSENPILAVCKIEGSTAGASRVDVTQLFAGETSAFSMSERAKKSYHLGGLKKESSFIQSIRTYPINTEVTTTKTYSAQAPDYSRSNPSDRGTYLPAGNLTGNVSVQLNTSFVLLPKEPMQRRLFDPRVGYFADSFSWYSDDQQAVKTKTFCCRWRLEPKEEDIEKMKRGELVEPKKQIVYYIDPATPKRWRKYLIEGVNDWQKAFEQAGFKNAIVGKEWPENDSTMSLEDARFSVIRYLASNIPNAYGPQVHDPRSGEIIESHIGWYHNVMKLVHDWYMVQAGAVDKRAQKMQFDDELMGDLIRFVSSHEVGHTLGLRHNMGSSSLTPVEKLRDKEWVEANGHTVSIMDYARFNYVAQPEDNIDSRGIYPRIGEYDKWAIEFGYKPTFAADDETDHKIWNKEIVRRLKENPRLWFGGEGMDNDPAAQTEDLGDNAMQASEYGLKNLRRVVKALPEWTWEEADMNANLSRVYGEVIGQYQRYMGHVLSNIGGVYHHYKSVEEEGDVYEAVPKARQKEALDYVNRNLFQKPEWLIFEPYMMRITREPNRYLYRLIDAAFGVPSRAGVLLDFNALRRMQEFVDQDANNYAPEEYLSDMTKLVFTELDANKKVDSYRRYLQRAYVNRAITLLTQKGNEQADVRSLLLAQLTSVYNKAKAKSSLSSLDAVTRAHWADLAGMINEKVLDKK